MKLHIAWNVIWKCRSQNQWMGSQHGTASIMRPHSVPDSSSDYARLCRVTKDLVQGFPNPRAGTLGHVAGLGKSITGIHTEEETLIQRHPQKKEAPSNRDASMLTTFITTKSLSPWEIPSAPGNTHSYRAISWDSSRFIKRFLNIILRSRVLPLWLGTVSI